MIVCKIKNILYVFMLLLLCCCNAQAGDYPKRIVSASPCFTEILYSLGLGDRIVGVTKYCTYPPEAKKKTKVGDMNLNYEAVVKLKPDLVVAMPRGDGENIRMLQAKGLKTLSLKCYSLKSFRSAVFKIASATGTQARAKEIMKAFDRRISLLKSKSAGQKTHKKKVFVEVWDMPLMTAGKNSYISEIIDIAGGVNSGDAISEIYGSVSTEFLYRENPDVIFLTTSKKAKPSWKGVNAVRKQQVFYLDPDQFARPSFRMVDSAYKIYDLLYGTGK